MVKTHFLSRVEIDKKALKYNIDAFKSLIARGWKGARGNGTHESFGRNRSEADRAKLCLCIKANAYGHGIIECAKIIIGSGQREKNIWFGINSVAEADILRGAGIKNPLYIMGYVPFDQMETAIKLGCRLVVYNAETIERLNKIARRLRKRVPIHIKIETGNNRQGVLTDDVAEFARKITRLPALILEGASTHFANIEDTTNHSYAYYQFENFLSAARKIEKAIGAEIPIKHCANTAATILFPKMHLDMVRIGVGLYGLWPSKETYVSAQRETRSSGMNSFVVDLKPVLSWKTHVAQIKEIPEGSCIGYGCTYKTTVKTRLAILPVGYYDGYDRGLSSAAYVLIKGKRSPVRGRVCMNITMVDITNIHGVKLEEEVVLIGRQGNENISIEQIADWCNTINYEIPTRINERVPRVVI